ncbi:16S rRNA (guanine(527)-N(7))-methyltransferase RsmG [Aquirhabdus parva]|uniref:Ribosomal RNA small subunit methyltransferase G n=1 Tax=Aquirhabdus parva TaxID=2283318 RepID=A0A345P691_9GAMM|nr:16S rRNA (guanine(527)-N(7))-methyltransferase RsmG [Aquirhabdus parva]AXI02800.1 16S rRNA (guanine(527)-N(7))-methyltransferase RsmG [Aquirhabdus parva]
MHPLFSKLKDGSLKLGLELSDDTLSKLLQYQDNLSLWNKAYNLTAIRDPKEMLVKHLLDSLSIIPHLPEGRLLDVGTGGGLPGFVIAIVQPERDCVLLDSNGKKIRFLRQMTADMKMPNVLPVQARIEEPQTLADLGQFNVVTSRAFAALSDFVRDCAVYLKPNAVLAAMKGLIPREEMADMDSWDQQTITLTVPALDEQRHLILLTKKMTA